MLCYAIAVQCADVMSNMYSAVIFYHFMVMNNNYKGGIILFIDRQNNKLAKSATFKKPKGGVKIKCIYSHTVGVRTQPGWIFP